MTLKQHVNDLRKRAQTWKGAYSHLAHEAGVSYWWLQKFCKDADNEIASRVDVLIKLEKALNRLDRSAA